MGKKLKVSIPRSGFWVFKRLQSSEVSSAHSTFQSLGRDSGCSSYAFCADLDGAIDVSIPRSGFWVFKRFVSRQPEEG